MTEANFWTFQHYKSQNHDLFQYRLRSANSYMTAKKTMDIKLCGQHRC